MKKLNTKTLTDQLPAVPPASTAIIAPLEGERLPYSKPALVSFGRIDVVTQGSGGSCTDGVNFDKALTGSGKCP